MSLRTGLGRRMIAHRKGSEIWLLVHIFFCHFLHRVPGEVFFIPRPGAEAEDDGVLVTVVFDGEQSRSYLLLLDGQTFTEVNRSYLPFKVPFSFHGNWFPELH